MKHPDRPVPLLFEEFSPAEQQQSSLALNPLQPSLHPADAAAALSPAELLVSVIAIAQQLIGAKVCLINQEHWTSRVEAKSNLNFLSALLSRQQIFTLRACLSSALPEQSVWDQVLSHCML